MNTSRRLKLNNIQKENVKLFNNLINTKSTLSRKDLIRHNDTYSNLQKLLKHEVGKEDPLIKIERKIKLNKYM
jgi:hypothetical protein